MGDDDKLLVKEGGNDGDFDEDFDGDFDEDFDEDVDEDLDEDLDEDVDGDDDEDVDGDDDDDMPSMDDIPQECLILACEECLDDIMDCEEDDMDCLEGVAASDNCKACPCADDDGPSFDDIPEKCRTSDCRKCLDKHLECAGLGPDCHKEADNSQPC